MNEQNQSIRVLSVVPYKVFPAVMGGQKGIALFYQYFSKFVALACITVKKNEPNEPYTVMNTLPNSKSRYFNPSLFFKIKNIAIENDCTHILFEHPYYAWMIFLMKKFTSLKIIVHSHNIESERFKSIGKWWSKLLWFYEGFAYRQANEVWFKTNEDKNYAQLYYKLNKANCATIPYGTELTSLPDEGELSRARLQLQTMYDIETHHQIILFNGTLSYKPNLDALKSIIHQINPILKQEGLRYKILVCGKGLPEEMNQLKEHQSSNIIYCGFVDDIDLYFKGCDLFLNPLQDGGGIKTKLVEALGFGKKCVSSVNGAIGVDEACCGGRLKIVADKDWNAYAMSLIEMSTKTIQNNHQAFYETYSWPSIAEKAMRSLV